MNMHNYKFKNVDTLELDIYGFGTGWDANLKLTHLEGGEGFKYLEDSEIVLHWHFTEAESEKPAHIEVFAEFELKTNSDSHTIEIMNKNLSEKEEKHLQNDSLWDNERIIKDAISHLKIVDEAILKIVDEDSKKDIFLQEDMSKTVYVVYDRHHVDFTFYLEEKEIGQIEAMTLQEYVDHTFQNTSDSTIYSAEGKKVVERKHTNFVYAHDYDSEAEAEANVSYHKLVDINIAGDKGAQDYLPYFSNLESAKNWQKSVFEFEEECRLERLEEEGTQCATAK